ncbi:hypothetical protein PENSPDRAFT_748623 [Peniophora sp. CONT]|nr:hypothetical protein PENSPDRAFT_748623 [Peniophora sp. CONT]
MDVSLDLEDVPRSHPLIAAFDLHASILNERLSGNTFPGTSVRENVARDWDLTERALELLLTEVRLRRNTSVPAMSGLPPELLSSIFTLLVYAEPPQIAVSASKMDRLEIFREEYLNDVDDNTWEYVHRRQRGTLGWMRLTHVCAHWRRILLQTPRVWGDHMGYLPRANIECLRRAGDALPLDLTNICVANSYPWSLIAPNLNLDPSQTELFCSRLRGLHIIDLRSSTQRADEFYEDLEFRNLEVLNVSITPDSSPLPLDWDQIPVLRAPRLRRITFRNVFITWQANTLVYLSLHLRHTTKIPSATLIELIAHSRETLQFLELFWASQVLEPGFDTASIKELSLPQLQTLHLADMDLQEGNFLQLVRLPSAVKLKMDIYCEPVYQPDWNSRTRLGVPVALALERSHCGPRLDGLFIASQRQYAEDDEDSRIDMTIHCDAASFANSTSFDGMPTRDSPKLHFVADANGMPPYWLDNVLISICRAVSPSRFTFVSFDLPFWRAADIKAVISHFPNLRFLRVTDPLNIDHKSKNPFGPAPYLGEAINELPEILEAESQQGRQGGANDNENWEDGREAAFPYLPGIAPGAGPSAGSVSSPSRSLEMLWLVQSRALKGTFAAWCEHVARQLRNSQQQTTTLPPKPVEILRIEFTTRISDEELSSAENLVYGTFEELADVVQWKINRG